MQQVKIYIETDSSSPKATEKHYGYVLEVMVSGQAVTREGFGKITGTYHQTVLTALAKALDRFNQSCEVCICTEDDFVLNMLERNLAIWAGNEFLTSKRKPVATTYADYLSMRINLGYDLNNTVYQQPQDLEAEHNKMVMETNKEGMDKHLKEVAERYPEIRHVYRGLRNKYLYEDDKYIIRPARSAEEIVMEGRLLHHCVGGDTYLGRHNTGKTYILMLRFKAEPDVPYITVEIDAKNPRILQWYGDKDKKPDEKNMQSWLNTWLMKLKTGTLTETIQTAAIA